MISISKNVYIDKLDDKVKEYNNTHHRTFKMKPTDVNSSTYIDFHVENNEKDPKFKFRYQVRISNIILKQFYKSLLSNSSEDVL